MTRPPLPPNSLLQTPAQIFQYRQWKRPKKAALPKLNESQPLSLFFYADEHLNASIRSLQLVENISTDKFRRRCEKVHRNQRVLLDTIYLIYNDLNDSDRADRSYRRQLPPDDQRELENCFSENIIFAAQAISRGFRIRGIEEYTTELLAPAQRLTATFEAVRCRFRSMCVDHQHPHGPYDDLFDILMEFDKVWCDFEKKICFCYFTVTYTGSVPDLDQTSMVQVLMSETMLYAVRKALITHEGIAALDPGIMLTVPRLMIVSGLVHLPEYVCMVDEEKGFRWFRQRAKDLQIIQDELKAMELDRVEKLEKMLVVVDDIENENQNIDNDPDLKRLYKAICSVADELQSNPRAREFVSLMHKVFMMHLPKDDVEDEKALREKRKKERRNSMQRQQQQQQQQQQQLQLQQQQQEQQSVRRSSSISDALYRRFSGIWRS